MAFSLLCCWPKLVLYMKYVLVKGISKRSAATTRVSCRSVLRKAPCCGCTAAAIATAAAAAVAAAVANPVAAAW
jgi:hypothetical protein